MTLEEQVTRGHAVWISSFRFDFVERTAILNCTTNPEAGTVDRKVIFSGVGDVKVDRLDGPEENCLETLIGLEETKHERYTLYVLNTGNTEIAFEANHDAQVAAVTPVP